MAMVMISASFPHGMDVPARINYIAESEYYRILRYSANTEYRMDTLHP